MENGCQPEGVKNVQGTLPTPVGEGFRAAWLCLPIAHLPPVGAFRFQHRDAAAETQLQAGSGCGILDQPAEIQHEPSP